MSNYHAPKSAQGYMNPTAAYTVMGGASCGAGDEKPEKNPSTCGSSCGAGDEQPKPGACGSSCGAGDEQPKPSACGAGDGK